MGRLKAAEKRLAFVKTESYVKSLIGTLGADPIHDGYNMNEVADRIPTDTIT